VHRHWLSIALLTGLGGTAFAGDDRYDEDPCAEPPPAVPDAVDKRTVHGNVRGQTTKEAAVGATVVATRIGALAGSVSEEVAISDEIGNYTLALAPGTYELTIYYVNLTTVLPRVEVRTTDVQLGITWLNEDSAETRCSFDFGWDRGPELTSMPRFGLTVSRGFTPVSRDRTHRAWIAPVAAADPRTAVTSVDGAARLPGAPGIPIAFVEEVSTYTLRTPIGTAGGSGGSSEVALRAGSNEPRAEARVILELAREADATAAAGGAELLTAGPLAHDKAWVTAGVVANRAGDGTVGASGMLRLDYAKSAEHQLSLAGLAQAPDPYTRDGWSRLHWTSKFDDDKLELDGIASAEQLELTSAAARGVATSAAITNRVGAQAGLTWRKKAAGSHHLRFVAGGGTGYRGLARHADVEVGAGDVWQVRPNLELELGVRSDTRVFDRDRATVTSPRLSLTWDVSKEGRSDVFVAYQRVPHLDDGMPGDWRTGTARFHDELATGASHVRASGWPIMVGVAGRARSGQQALEDTLGAEAWARVDAKRTSLHVSATTLGRIATVMAQRTAVKRSANTLVVGATLRASPETTTAGAGVTWKHAGRRSEKPDDLSFDVATEAYTSEAGPAFRLLLGGLW
jgi:hypothetical protein